MTAFTVDRSKDVFGCPKGPLCLYGGIERQSFFAFESRSRRGIQLNQGGSKLYQLLGIVFCFLKHSGVYFEGEHCP